MSVREAHHDNETRSDRENHEIQKATEQEPCLPKFDPNGHESGPPDHPYGPASPALLRLASRFVYGQVCIPYDSFSPILLSISN